MSKSHRTFSVSKALLVSISGGGEDILGRFSHLRAVMPNENLKLKLLVKELSDQVDLLWLLKKNGHSANLSMRLLRETASPLPDLPPELQSEYLNMLVDYFVDVPPPVVEASKQLPGNSSEGLAATAGLSLKRNVS